MKQFNVTKSYLPNYDEYCHEIKDIWEKHWLTNMGEKHNKLENELCNYLGVENCSLFSNGHLALEAILRVLNIKGEVITSPYTFVSTTHALTRLGIKPVFCDIKEDDFTIDETKIESLINEKTTAILGIHVYGNICNNEAIETIAKKHGLKLIYDAAHAFGVKYKGKSIATFGDASMFSFHATKVFHTIEGGAITYNDTSLKNKINLEKNFGIPNEDEVIYPGGNAKMNEFQAAMGLCNLKHINEIINSRKALYERYVQNLSGLNIILNKCQDNTESNYSYMPVLFDENIRDKVHLELKKRNINTRKYFYPLCNECKCYDDTSNTTPIAKKISRQVLTLPMYPDLDLNDVDYICQNIKEIIIGY